MGYRWHGHHRTAERHRLDALWEADQHTPALLERAGPKTLHATLPNRPLAQTPPAAMTRTTKPNQLDAIRAGRILEHLVADLRDQHDHSDHNDGAGLVLAHLVQRLLDGTAVDTALLDAAHDYQDAAQRAKQHRADRAAAAAHRAHDRELERAKARAIIDAHPCPRCDAPAGEPCTSLGPVRRTKPPSEAHAARLALGDTTNQ